MEQIIDFVIANGYQFGIGLIRTLLMGQVMQQTLPYSFDTGIPPAEVYDFVIVGAGVGGSVVASRLSETGASVLLLEAGTDAPPESVVPGLHVLLHLREEDWKYKAKNTGQTQLGYLNKDVGIRTGKLMGGTTTINSLLSIRASRADMNNWAQLGNTGWDYDSVLPYFLKSEDYNGPNLTAETGPFHQRGGPVSLERREPSAPMGIAFINAGKEMGYQEKDPNLPDFIGFTKPYLNTKNGVRVSASETYLRPVADRPNLTITPRAIVRRVIFNRNKRAVGVEYVYENKLRKVHCRKEVILSAGSLNTPKILMLSGVGPKQHLQDIKIPLVAAVEGVGLNLQNHPALALPFKVTRGSTSPIQLNLAGFIEYFDSQTGILAKGWGGNALCFLNFNDTSSQRPDAWVQVDSVTFGGQDSRLIEQRMGLDRKIIDDIFGHLTSDESMTMNAFLSRPKSRGSVTLQSNIFTDPPVVEDEPCTHPDDMELALTIIKWIFEVANTQSMKFVSNPEFSSKMRYCSQHEYRSDDFWRCFIRYTAFSGWHYAGTAKMAPNSDHLGVVSPRLKVRGVSGLRVIDASIMPEIVTPNPMSSIYMIGEKGADMIKQDWGYLSR